MNTKKAKASKKTFCIKHKALGFKLNAKKQIALVKEIKNTNLLLGKIRVL